MVKHTQTIRRQFFLSVFDHFMGLAIKGLRFINEIKQIRLNHVSAIKIEF